MKSTTPLLALILYSSSSGYTYADCDEVIIAAGRNTQISSGSSATIANKYANACSYDRTTTDDQLVADLDVEIFGEGAGNGHLSTQSRKDRINQWCDTNKTTYENNQAAFSETQSVYGDSVRAWQACKRLENRNIKLNPKIATDMLSANFFLTISVGKAQFSGLYARGFTCKMTVNRDGNLIEVPPTKVKDIDNDGLKISCERIRKDQVKIDGQLVDRYDSGVINIDAASEAFDLNFDSMTKPNLTDKTKEALQIEIDQLRQAINNGTKQVHDSLSADLQKEAQDRQIAINTATNSSTQTMTDRFKAYDDLFKGVAIFRLVPADNTVACLGNAGDTPGYPTRLCGPMGPHGEPNIKDTSPGTYPMWWRLWKYNGP